MVHRLPLWFDRFDVLTALRLSKGFAHHPEPVEGRSGPPAHIRNGRLRSAENLKGEFQSRQLLSNLGLEKIVASFFSGSKHGVKTSQVEGERVGVSSSLPWRANQ